MIGLGAIILLGLALRPHTFAGSILQSPQTAYDFTLSGPDNTTVSLGDFRGKVVLLFFGYTSCPDICPTTLAELRQAMERLDEREAERVQVVFVTVDPARDTPERVQEYVSHFDPGFIGLSGPEPDLQTVWNKYGIFREVVEGTSALGYIVNHTARVTLIDADGNLRISFSFETPVDDIVHDLKLILKEEK